MVKKRQKPTFDLTECFCKDTTFTGRIPGSTKRIVGKNCECESLDNKTNGKIRTFKTKIARIE